MKTLYTFLFSILCIYSLSAQTTIRGHISSKSGESVTGANVYIKGTYDGVSSDVNGDFTLMTTLSGEQVLVVSFIGYKTWENTIQLTGDVLKLDIVLKEESSNLDPVIITAGAFEASDEKKAVVLRPLDIVTTAGGSGDIYGVMNTLPGTTIVGESGEIFVRGGDNHEVKTYIDGMLVPDPYYSSMPDVPTRGRFSPFLFDGTTFSTGGYSAEYGQAMSSALILNTTGLADQTITGLSLMSIGLGASHQQAWKNTSFALEGSWTDLDPYYRSFKQDMDWDRGPYGFDGAMNFRQKLGDEGLLKTFVSFSNGGAAINYPDFDNPGTAFLLDFKSNNLYVNTTYQDILEKDWLIRGGVAYARDEEDNIYGKNHIDELHESKEAKIVAKKIFSDHFNLKFGANLQDKKYQSDYQYEDTGAVYESRYEDLLMAGFVESEARINSKFAARIGLRYAYSDYLQKGSLAPRVSLAYKTGKHSQMSMAYGAFYQNPNITYMRFTDQLDLQKATHYIVNYQYMKENNTFRIEAYYKEYDNLVKYDSLYSPDPAAYNNLGSGFARGIDVFWRNTTIKNTDYWISYSFIDTERNFENYPEQAVPTFVSKHNLSVVAKHYLPKITSQLSLTYNFASGRTYYNPNNEDFLSDKTDSYKDLSFSMSKLFFIKGHFSVLFFQVTNLLGFDNTFGYHYSNIPDSNGIYDGFAIKPSAKRFYFIGLFVSIVKEEKVK